MGIRGDLMNTYKIEITFNTNTKLTVNELDNLENSILLQIAEPMDADQELEEYETGGTTYEIERIK
jgi:hypothetical protein